MTLEDVHMVFPLHEWRLKVGVLAYSIMSLSTDTDTACIANMLISANAVRDRILYNLHG